MEMKNLGLIALLVGWILLTTWGLFKGILESESLIMTVSFIVIWVGLLILLVTSIIQRVKESKDDPYKDVEI